LAFRAALRFGGLCCAFASLLGANLATAADSKAGHLELPLSVAPQRAVPVDASALGLDQLVPVPPDAPIQHHYVVPGETQISLGEPTGTLVYANTGGTVAFPPGADRLVADDIIVSAVGGCDLSAYEILVTGYGDGTGPGFTVDVALYDSCPGTGGIVIPGTDDSIALDNDGLHLITIDLTGAQIPINASLWIGVQFSIAQAGWVMGSPAEVGYTNNVYHHPFLACVATFGGSSLYAGFYAKLYCTGEFDTQYLAYLNNTTVSSYVAGSNQTVLDDIELIADECVLSGYEVGLIGDFGPYEAEIELWFDCDQASAIPGSGGTFQGLGDGTVEVARFIFEEGVELPAPIFWVAITPDAAATGPAIAGEPVIGVSQDLFARWNEPGSPDQCNYYWFGGNPYAAFWVTVFCLGSPPMGACCTVPPPPGESPCREVAQIGCAGGRWIQGATCDPDPFTPPCGTHACCLPDSSCEDLTEADCIAADGLWHQGQFCNLGLGVDCPFFACLNGEGDCCEARSSTGCQSETCCNAVCDMDDWCCRVEWDQVCAEEARQICNPTCALGEVTWIDPEDGVVDARQPHAVDDATELQGIAAVTVAAPSGGASACCWTLCETDFYGGVPNFITDVEDHGDGSYTVNFERPVTPGSVTTLTYGGGDVTATFISHPGNADGNVESAPADILAVIDYLNGIESACPWGVYGCDADQSGECGPADILRVIDLLNGAGEFDSWNGTLRPEGSGLCP
jgi:hypothetical protein